MFQGRLDTKVPDTHLSLWVLLQLTIKLLLVSCHANAPTFKLPVLSS
jgi:hypothetical protein